MAQVSNTSHVSSAWQQAYDNSQEDISKMKGAQSDLQSISSRVTANHGSAGDGIGKDDLNKINTDLNNMAHFQTDAHNNVKSMSNIALTDAQTNPDAAQNENKMNAFTVGQEKDLNNAFMQAYNQAGSNLAGTDGKADDAHGGAALGAAITAGVNNGDKTGVNNAFFGTGGASQGLSNFNGDLDNQFAISNNQSADSVAAGIGGNDQHQLEQQVTSGNLAAGTTQDQNTDVNSRQGNQNQQINQLLGINQVQSLT